MEEIKNLIASNLKSFREEQNLTKVELAKKISKYLGKELDSSYLTTWESGKCNPNMETMIAICKALNVSLDELIYGVKGEFVDYCYNQVEKINKGIRIPVLGTIRAGIPNQAIEDIIDYEEISEEMARHGKHFALKIKGDSMLPKIIEDDIVIFKECSDAENGDICAVLVNGDEATVKKIKKTNDGIYLIPFNTDEFEPMFFSKEDVEKKPVQIIGKAVEIRRSI